MVATEGNEVQVSSVVAMRPQGMTQWYWPQRVGMSVTNEHGADIRNTPRL